ncbi:MAG: 2-oxoacid:acceptor oxidoreductase subunit alpha [Chthonomonadales bacterium]|nr:2-oxoacid:acceptor oxidoreductase subunit alpha [Chthonomonadales bacterium]
MAQGASAATAVADIVLRLVGESGEGTVTLGDVMVDMFTMAGLRVYTQQTFPAEIKGGTVMYQIRAAAHAPLAHGDAADIVVALNAEGFDTFGAVLREGGILLYNADAFTPEPDPGRVDIALPITALARAEKEAVRHSVSAEALKRLPPPINTVGLGALLRVCGMPLEPAAEYLGHVFARKGEAIVGMNHSALRAGAAHVEEQLGDRAAVRVVSVPRMVGAITANGNQMLSLGAIAAGLELYAGYPITPASEIMEFLARELPAFGGNVVQAEDEIAALAMCLGASFAGARAMTASSGPGISLMVEQINLAGQAELPVVIVDVQRGGASTGLPTKTSQGDLNLALFGVHNESPRIVLAAADAADCYQAAIDAVALAEIYQCPVLLLSDQDLASSKVTMLAPDPSEAAPVRRLAPTEADLTPTYWRYRDTATGVSPMAVPGTSGFVYTSTGIEHDEGGDPGYTPAIAAAMKRKRFRKLDTLLSDAPCEPAREWGDDDEVEVGIIAFGSTEGVIREATERARAEGFRVAHLHLRLLNPLPVARIQAFADRCRSLLVPELNYSGQLAGWLRSQARVDAAGLTKDEGVPFLANEVYLAITRAAGCRQAAANAQGGSA